MVIFIVLEKNMTGTPEPTLIYFKTNKNNSLTRYRWAVRVSPVICNRIVESARSILNKFLPDIYIYTDHHKGSKSGKYVYLHNSI